ncbi:hypothetical protein NDU88_006591 [Pleurodeles waltl]|uniref:Uncharacterized protein n=1 Tax=Pleurodeles waltl TaxID=8319 RepID=A0AAV7NZS9_PLEWA|nr:hypothetical protein NDU88_006591 [Pleurodeles waltl]
MYGKIGLQPPRSNGPACPADDEEAGLRPAAFEKQRPGHVQFGPSTPSGVATGGALSLKLCGCIAGGKRTGVQCALSQGDHSSGSSAGWDGLYCIHILAAETKSICLDIASFQSRVSDLEQCVVAVEDHLNTVPDRDRELLFICSKLVDLEDRSRRDNVRFFGFPGLVEGADIQEFLKETLPALTGISFDPPLEFQRVHRLGQKRAEDSRRPHPVIACLLCHTQARQLIFTACSQGLFQANGYEIHVVADFPKETNERHKAFLSFYPGLCQLEVKYGLFEPAWMWVTKNSQSQDFCDPGDLQLYLGDLTPTSMDMTPQTLRADVTQNSSDPMLPLISSDGRSPGGREVHQRGRDQMKHPRPYDDRGKALLAVVHHSQQADRDKSRSPLKPSPAST